MKKIYLLSLFLLSAISFVSGQDLTVTGKITDETGPLPGVNILVKGTTIGAISDFDGNYSISAPSTATLVFSYIGYGSKEVAVDGKTTVNVVLAASAQQLAEMIVVGTRGQARTKLQTAAPVDVISISKQQINMPQLDVANMLVASAPSFSAVRSQAGDLSTAVNPPQLRGLAPNQLLVLVNGKRRHSGAQLISTATGGSANSVDLDFIPADGIERIEVLRDGASAQYGSDAIAGVINMITKKGTNKFTANYSMGVYTNSNPDVSGSNLSEENKSVLENNTGDTFDGFTHQLGANYGLSFDNGGYLNITGMYRQNEAALRLAVYNGNPYGSAYLNNEKQDASGNPIITNPELLAAQSAGDAALAATLTTDDGLLEARNLTRADVSNYAGLSPQIFGSVAYNLELPLTEDANFYSFGDFGYKNTDGFGCYYRKASQNDRFNYDLYPNGFRPQMIITQTNIGFINGIEGKLGDWDFDFSNTFGTNKQRYGQFNTINASFGSESPTEMDLGTHTFSQNTTNFDLTKFFPDVLSGLNIAAGAEVRVENYSIERGQEESYLPGDAGAFYATENNQALVGPDGFPLEDLSGNPIVDADGNPIILANADASSYNVLGYSPNCQCFRGFAPENEANQFRSVTGLYFDAELDITDDWFVSGALRTEQYSDFGGVFTGKLASRWAITEDLALRGSLSNGFRAPSLQELNYSHTFTYFLDPNTPVNATVYPNRSASAKALGINQLTEEKSTSYGLGFTAKLFKKLELTVDAYKINIKDRLFATGSFTAANAPVLAPLIGGGEARFRINGGDVSTSGVEIVTNYTDTLGEGSMNVMLSAVFSERTFEGANVPELNTALSSDDLEAIYIDRSVIGNYEEGIPTTRLIGSFTYSLGKWSTMLRGNYFGEYTEFDNGLGTLTDENFAGVGTTGYSDQTFSAQFTTDLGITYAASKNLSLTLTGQNIFNNYTDLRREEERGFFLYGNGQQGSLGANYLVRATLSF